MLKVLTPLSSSLEYILISDDSKFYDFYHMKLKFKNKKTLYDYEIKKQVWHTILEKQIEASNGLNIGKLIWGYIIMGDVIQYKSYREIMQEEDE